MLNSNHETHALDYSLKLANADLNVIAHVFHD